jgi:hypothetical protein
MRLAVKNTVVSLLRKGVSDMFELLQKLLIGLGAISIVIFIVGLACSE